MIGMEISCFVKFSVHVYCPRRLISSSSHFCVRVSVYVSLSLYHRCYVSVSIAVFVTPKVGKTFLQMKLTVDSGGGGPGRLVFMELSLEQFYHFMAQMEKAKAYLDFVAAA